MSPLCFIIVVDLEKWGKIGQVFSANEIEDTLWMEWGKDKKIVEIPFEDYVRILNSR